MVVPALLLPTVSVPLPMARLPPPERPPSVALNPSRLRLPPLRTTVESCRAKALPICNQPLLMVVAPAYVFAAARTSVPEPVFVRPPTPLTLPLMVKESAALVTLTRFPGEASASGAAITWMPERTLTRHSLAAPLVEDKVSV